MFSWAKNAAQSAYVLGLPSSHPASLLAPPRPGPDYHKKFSNPFLRTAYRLSTVAGTAEPIYGPEAFHSVALQADQNPKHEITKQDVQWAVLDYTSVETQTFYFVSDGGHIGLAQVIYSNVLYVIRICRHRRALGRHSLLFGICILIMSAK